MSIVKGSAAEVARILELDAAPGRARPSAPGCSSPGAAARASCASPSRISLFLKTARARLFAAPAHPRAIACARTLRSCAASSPSRSAASGTSHRGRGDRIVVSDGRAPLAAGSGQALFDFGVADLERRSSRASRAAARFRARRKQRKHDLGRAMVPVGLRARGGRLRGGPTEAYRQRVGDPGAADAHVNLGRLLHEAGDAARRRGSITTALSRSVPKTRRPRSNMGVAAGGSRTGVADALAAYEGGLRSIRRTPTRTTTPASLCERLGRPADAVRHLKDYRVLTRGRPQ